MTKNSAREQVKELVAKKKKLHSDIMSRDNKDLDPLTHATYKTVLDRLQIKDKKMYSISTEREKHLKMQCSNTTNHW